MMMKFVLVLALFAFARSQVLDPPTRTRIRWADVKPTSFRVTWQGPANAFMYTANLYENFAQVPMRQYENVTEEYLMIRGLKLSTNYAVKVQCVGEDGSLSRLGRAGRTRTFGVPTTTTTTTVAPSVPTPTGECGAGNFTCESNPEECIDGSWWCDRRRDCSDGSDERNCPGSCEEIVDFHPAGNFSCSRFNSPRSACFFQCNGDYYRRGAFYTVCVQRQWSRGIPTCVLRSLRGLAVVNDRTLPDAIQFEFENILSAERYEIARIADVSTGLRVPTAVLEVDNVIDNIASGIISGLDGRRQYRFSIVAVDSDNVRGVASRTVVGNTAPERK